MGYPWASGVSRLSDTSLALTTLTSTYRFLDYCPAIEDGVSSECPEFTDTDASAEEIIVSCRGESHIVFTFETGDTLSCNLRLKSAKDITIDVAMK